MPIHVALTPFKKINKRRTNIIKTWRLKLPTTEARELSDDKDDKSRTKRNFD